jgi:hypothetical protein
MCLNETFIREWSDPEGSLPPGLQPFRKEVPKRTMPLGAHGTRPCRTPGNRSPGFSGMIKQTPGEKETNARCSTRLLDHSPTR